LAWHAAIQLGLNSISEPVALIEGRRDTMQDFGAAPFEPLLLRRKILSPCSHYSKLHLPQKYEMFVYFD
jgi:hypothetical protein